MSKHRLNDADYAGFVKILRKVAPGFDAADGYDLRYPLSKARKERVRAYASEMQRLTNRSYISFSSKSKSDLSLAQNFSQHDPHYKFKVAFVPYASHTGETPKVSVRQGILTISGSESIKRFVPFEPEELALEPEIEVRRAWQLMGTGVRHFTLQTGDYETRAGFDVVTASTEVLKLMERYNGLTMPADSRHRNDNPSVHDYRKWLHGINGYTFTRPQVGRKQMIAAQEATRRRIKKDKEKARRAAAKRRKAR